MEKKNLRPKRGPESEIQAKIIEYMKIRDWLVKETHGNIYQYGFPDLWCSHSRYGHRWIEVKNPLKYEFTPAQLDFFPKLCANGSGVWIMVAANEDEYKKLFERPNWYIYLMTKL